MAEQKRKEVGVRGHKEGAEILERLEALPALCKTN